MTRQRVFEIIDTERNSQEMLKNDPEVLHVIPDFHLGDCLTAIQHNLNLAISEWYNGSGNHTAAMGYLRKIAALCVQSGEQYEMPVR